MVSLELLLIGRCCDCLACRCTGAVCQIGGRFGLMDYKNDAVASRQSSTGIL
jgi:hypothetical protein